MEKGEEKIRKYLLGDLQESEMEAIDRQIFSDEITAENLHLAEDALMEDYLDEALSPAETGLFHENFLISETRKNQLAQLAALKKYVRNKTENKKAENEKKNVNRNLKYFFGFRRAAIAFGLLIIALVGIGVWQLNFNSKNENSALAEEIAALNKQDLGDLKKYENFSKLSLLPGQLRSSDAKTTLEDDGISQTVLIRLALPPEETAQKFNLKIVRNGKENISLDDVSVYDNQIGKEIRLLVPSSFLKAGEYKIELSPENENVFPVNYSFTVR